MRLGVSAVRHDMKREETVEEVEKNTKWQRRTPKRKPVPTAPRPVLEGKKRDNGQAAALSGACLPGVRLVHKTFGPGQLESRSGDVAVIAFDSGDTRKIALSVALRAGQLRLE